MSMGRTSRAVGMLEAGKTQRHIAERPNVSQSVIGFLRNQYFQREIVKVNQNRDVKDVRQFMGTVIWPMLPRGTVSKVLLSLMLNFREH